MLRSALCISCLFFFLAFPIALAAAEKGVVLSPLRMVIEGRDRSATLRIINPNDRPVTYRIDAEVLDQDVYGNLKISENKERTEAILQMIRFSPRQVLLEPGAMQAVRIMVKKPAKLADGEYRAHIKVSPMPAPEAPDKTEPTESSGETRIDLRFLVATSIPLIIRHGETAVRLEAQGLKAQTFSDGKKAFKTRIFAKGNQSAYMDAALFHGTSLVGEMKGFAVYQPLGEREVMIPLKGEFPPVGNPLRLLLYDREKEGTPLIREIPLTLEP
jgi:P pilus assembly chaperone PapD